MRSLIDECLPRRLKNYFASHAAATVSDVGWSGKRNGELLTLAESQFDFFVTIDQNLNYQQSLKNRQIAVVVLVASSNRLVDLLPLTPF